MSKHTVGVVIDVNHVLCFFLNKYLPHKACLLCLKKCCWQTARRICADLTSVIKIRLIKEAWFLTLGLSRSLEVIGTDTNRPATYDFLLVYLSNFVTKTHRFRNIRLQKCCDLEILFRGPSRSLDIVAIQCSACDFLLTNGSISCRSFMRYLISKMSWPWNRVGGHSRSLKVVPLIDCIWFPISVL